VALADACAWLERERGVPNPFGRLVAAVSVGVVEGEARLDLAYAEDRVAAVDANVVVAAPSDYVEVQGTGEHGTFDRPQLDLLLTLAERGIEALFGHQRRALGW
jgi:ribonuclease PH